MVAACATSFSYLTSNKTNKKTNNKQTTTNQQLTQKKAVMQFKTLDSVLQTYHAATGEKSAVTYRCADMDRLVPGLMGVSKAVLENVIFVHQVGCGVWGLSVFILGGELVGGGRPREEGGEERRKRHHKNSTRKKTHTHTRTPQLGGEQLAADRRADAEEEV